MIIALLQGLLKCKVSIMACKFSKSRMVGEWRGLQEKEGSDFYSFFWLSKCIFEKRQMDLYVILNLRSGDFYKNTYKVPQKI